VTPVGRFFSLPKQGGIYVFGSAAFEKDLGLDVTLTHCEGAHCDGGAETRCVSIAHLTHLHLGIVTLCVFEDSYARSYNISRLLLASFQVARCKADEDWSFADVYPSGHDRTPHCISSRRPWQEQPEAITQI
jgi:hypothetical protein